MRNQIIKIVLLSSLTGAAAYSVGAQAQGIIRLYAGEAKTHYSIAFDQNTPSSLKAGRTIKSNYNAPVAGITWITSSGFYMDASASQSPSSATHDLWTPVTSQPQKFIHDDYQLTAGYVKVFNNGMSASGFGGYKYGHTEMDAPRPPIPWSKDKFDTRGVFFGVGGGFPVAGGRAGSVSVSGALAFMNGRWKDDTPPPNTFEQSADYTFGYSFGVGYTYKFTQAWGVTADYKYQRYNYNFNQYSVTNPAYTINEKISALGVRLSYQF